MTRAELFDAVSGIAEGDGWRAEGSPGDVLLFAKDSSGNALRLGVSFDSTAGPPQPCLVLVPRT